MANLSAVIIPVLLIAATAAIYTMIYQRHINRRLAEGEEWKKKHRRPMMSPLKFIFIFILTLLAVYILLVAILFILFSVNSDIGTSDDPPPVITLVRQYSDDDIDTSPCAMFDPGKDISGYTRKEYLDGSFRFVVYSLDSGVYNEFPQRLIYADYTGEKEDCTFGYDISYDSSHGRVSSSGNCSDADVHKNGIWFTVSGFYAPESHFEIRCGIMKPGIGQGAAIEVPDVSEEYGTYSENFTE